MPLSFSNRTNFRWIRTLPNKKKRAGDTGPLQVLRKFSRLRRYVGSVVGEGSRRIDADGERRAHEDAAGRTHFRSRCNRSSGAAVAEVSRVEVDRVTTLTKHGHDDPVLARARRHVDSRGRVGEVQRRLV